MTMAPARPRRQASPKATVPAQRATRQKAPRQRTSAKQVETVVNTMAMECFKLRYDAEWLPETRVTSRRSRDAMAREAGGKTKSFSGTKKLYDTEIDCVERYQQARRALELVRDRWTINLGRRTPDGRNTSESMRVIRVEDIKGFEKEFDEARAVVNAAVDAIREEIEEVRADAKDRLGSEYDPSAYADEALDRVYVGTPVYDEFKVSVTLPPDVQRRQLEQVRQAIATTAENGVKRMVQDFSTAFLRMATQISLRKRLRPVPQHALFKDARRAAEVIHEQRHADNDRVPEGQVRVLLRWETKEKRRTLRHEEWFGPIAESEYIEQLRPTTTDERRAMRGDGVGAIEGLLDNFTHLRNLLGPWGGSIDQCLAPVRAAVGELRERAADEEAVRETLRSDELLGGRLADALTGAVNDLQAVAEDAAEDINNYRSVISVNLE